MAEPNEQDWLRALTKPLRSIYREVFMMSFVVNLLALAVPVFTLQVYDRVIFSAGLTTLQGLVIGMAIVLLFDYILKQSRSRLMQRASLRIDVAVGNKLFNKILALPMAALENRPNAHWIALFRDVEIIRNTLSGPSAVLVTDLPFAVLFIALVVVIATPLVWVLAIVLPLFLILAWRSAAVLNAANKDERRSGFTRDAMVSEMIAGRQTIKALALDESIRPLWDDKHAETIEDAISRGRKSDSYGNIGGGLTMITTIAMTTVGALAIINQEMTIGSLIAANMPAGPDPRSVQSAGRLVADLHLVPAGGGKADRAVRRGRGAPRIGHRPGPAEGRNHPRERHVQLPQGWLPRHRRRAAADQAQCLRDHHGAERQRQDHPVEVDPRPLRADKGPRPNRRRRCVPVHAARIGELDRLCAAGDVPVFGHVA
jgi:ABC-type bacteriocin/lantibiotic exporter with double-glycine peptidase domain